MKFFSLLTIASAIAPAVALPAAPSDKVSTTPKKTCTNPPKKVEWRKLGAANQKNYLDSVLCLKTKPSRMGLKTSLYDDFPHIHFELNGYIHGGAPFLPWHRYFTVIYDKALRECGYKGPATYWDWTQDTKGLRLSPVMASKNGFGGNGDPNRLEWTAGGTKLMCVNNGPFSKLRPAYLEDEPRKIEAFSHCLFRNMPEVSEPDAFKQMTHTFGPEGVKETKANNNWQDFARSLEGGPHGSIHASLGGEMNPTTSPNEPLFFLHHAMIDRIWWEWQQKNASRLTEYNGMYTQYKETKPREVKLDDLLRYGGMEKDVKVRDVMDVTAGPLCYTY
ncbi:Monophenol monooxygenase Tyrosinase [Fusarium acuminatum]|uniref:Monophenol monooxygenase Tyrosinase n=1 Tax=Fusarium acuminatum TaxID=5515 RepID=A0ABZ2X6I5_9HYPO